MLEVPLTAYEIVTPNLLIKEAFENRHKAREFLFKEMLYLWTLIIPHNFCEPMSPQP